MQEIANAIEQLQRALQNNGMTLHAITVDGVRAHERIAFLASQKFGPFSQDYSGATGTKIYGVRILT